MPRYFPQLTSGATVQFPIRRTFRWRTIATESADGRQVRAADDRSPMIAWRCTYRALSDPEMQQIKNFFASCGGRLLEFTFADPNDNLLKWSEDFSQASWNRPPWGLVEPGGEDPLGGQGAWRLTNNGVTTASFGQTVAIPGYYGCVFTLYVRSETEGWIRLARTADGAEQHAYVRVDAAWRRAVFRTQLTVSGDASVFACEVAAGKTIEVFGAQVEAQPNPSEYKRTLSRGGLYTRCRFSRDELHTVSQGPNNHDVILDLESPWHP
jgi:hypothetical protein